jgi:hypothetical protein
MSVTEAMGEEEEEEKHQSNSPSGDAEITQAIQEEHSWPVIRFDVPPHRTYHFYHQFRTGPNPNNFLKGVKWYILVISLLCSEQFCVIFYFYFFWFLPHFELFCFWL